MKLIKLVMIFLIANIMGCAGVQIPLVTFNQFDAVNNQINPKRVTKYNNKTCKIETVREPSYAIILPDGTLNPKLHGGFLISAEDMNKLYECGETECKKELQRIFKEQLNAKD